MTLQRLLNQLGGAEIPVGDFEVADSVAAESVSTWTNARILHSLSLP